MDSLNFYKGLYDRELARRIALDNALNIPLTVLTIIVAANGYTMKDLGYIHTISDLRFAHVLVLLLSATLLTSIFYMMLSSNNLLKGFAYKNYGYVSEIRKYEEQLEAHNLKVIEEKDKVNFNNVIITKLTEWTDNHIIFNDKRSRDLYKSRVCLALAIVITVLNFLQTIIHHLKL
jgi:hypothetical protein